MNNLAPEDWKESSIGEITSTNSLFSDGDWVESKDQDPAGTNRLVQLADIGDGVFINKSSRYMNDEQFQRLKCTSLKKNDILIARMPDPLGRACLYPLESGKAATVVDVAILRTENADHYWLMSAINSSNYRYQIDLNASGTTRTRIARGILSEIKILEPPLPEQQKIATILSSVDDVIEKTRAQIDKLKDLKTGMMQELLTKGIGHTEFKDSPVGRIPVEWGIKALGEVATVFAGGTPSRSKPEYYGGDVPWVKSGEVNQQLIYGTEETITKLAVQESSARWAKKGAVLVAMYGATAGKVARLMINATLNQAVSAINGKEDKVDNGFLLYAIEYKNRELLNTLQGSGQPNLSGQLIKSLSLPIPPLYEQKKIYAALLSVDVKIERTYLKLNKLVFQKKALMQDLLTGKVRVNLTDKESAVV